MKSQYSYLSILLIFLATPVTTYAQTSTAAESTSTIETITPEGMNAPPHFSPVVTAMGQKTIYVSGMTGTFNDKTDALDEYETQLRQVYEKIGLALKAAGASPEHVVRQRVLIVGISQQHAAITRKVMEEFYGNTRPTSTATGTSGLFNPDLVVEVDVTAVLNK